MTAQAKLVLDRDRELAELQRTVMLSPSSSKRKAAMDRLDEIAREIGEEDAIVGRVVADPDGGFHYERTEP